jgi:hypothetical protein
LFLVLLFYSLSSFSVSLSFTPQGSVCSMEQSWATTCHSSCCFVWIYLLIIHYTSFPFLFFHFAQADIFLCLVTAPVRIFPYGNDCLQRCTNKYISPSIPATCINPIGCTTLLRAYHRPHSYLYELRPGTAGFLFEFLTLEYRADRLFRNVDKK